MVQESMTLFTGLAGDTPIILDGNISTIRNATIIKRDFHEKNTMSIDKDFKIVEGSLYSIKEGYSTNMWDFEVSSKLHFMCTPTTMILTPKGMKEVRQIAVGDQVWGATFSTEKGVEGAYFDVLVSKSKIYTLMQQCYYFAVKEQNILIPQLDEEHGNLILICVHQ